MSFLVTMPYRSNPAVEWMRQIARWLVLLGIAVLATGPTQLVYPAKIDHFMLGNYKIGGDFTLTNQSGRRTSLSDLSGKVVLLSFGYSNCPDICPTTLAEMGKVLRALGNKESSVRVVFITVDPHRDTPKRLTSYLANFHETMIGLTGSVKELTEVASQYSSKFRKEEPGPGSGYTVGHTTFVFILDQSGKARYVLPYDASSELMLNGVMKLLDGNI